MAAKAAMAMTKTMTKMSKSRGNVVLPEEVVHGVCDLAPGHEFRDRFGRLVDYRTQGVWLQAGRGYLTSTKFGRKPVFLHVKGETVPVLFLGWGRFNIRMNWAFGSICWRNSTLITGIYLTFLNRVVCFDERKSHGITLP